MSVSLCYVFSGVDLKKSIAKQRQLLNKRLGLDVAGNLGMETDIFDDNDLIMKEAHNKREPQANKNQVGIQYRHLIPAAVNRMSASTWLYKHP